MVTLLYTVGSLVVAVVIAGIVLSGMRRRVSTLQGLILWSRGNGWAFTAVDQTVPARFPQTPAASAAGGFAQRVLSGAIAGRPALVFECAVGSGASITTTTFVAVSLPAAVPPLSVHREGRGDLIARDLGFRDIEFENDTFNRQFKITGPNRAFAYDVLNPRMIEWLLQASAPEWQITGTDLVSWHAGRLTVPVLQADLAYTEGLLRNIPSFVWEKAAGSA